MFRLGASGDPGPRNRAWDGEVLSLLTCFKAMHMNPLGGGVDFVDGQTYFVKAAHVIVKVTFPIGRLLVQKVIT